MGNKYVTVVCSFKGCYKPAEFGIYDSNDHRPDSGPTFSCVDHVGHLLGSLPPVEPKGPWHVYYEPNNEFYETIDGKWWLFRDGKKVRELTDKEAANVIWGVLEGKNELKEESVT